MAAALSILRADLWLPRNITWGQVPPAPTDLLYPALFAPLAVLLRILYEALVGLPLAYAAAIFLFGVLVMYDKSWLYDVKQCWIGYPYHQVPTSIWWYYMLETGFYWTQLLGSTFDVRRSDYWQLVAHHVVTITLLSLSWTINFVRIGTLILLSHDLSDVFLEDGKLIRYDGRYAKITNIFFVFFFSSWIGARLIYFPFVLLRSAIYDAPRLIQPDYNLSDPFQIPYAPRVVIFMLICLLALHIFWTVLIVKVLIRTLSSGQAADDREDDSEGDATLKKEKQVKEKQNKEKKKTK